MLSPPNNGWVRHFFTKAFCIVNIKLMMKLQIEVEADGSALVCFEVGTPIVVQCV